MRLVLVAAAMLALLASAAPAALAADPPAPPATPDPSATSEPGGLIRDLYTRYYAALNAMNDNPDASMPEEFEFGAIADKYFEPGLAKRVNRALASDEPVFDWDWLVNGQDFGELKIIAVDTVTNDGTVSTVTITTSNFGQASTTGYDLKMIGGAWKVTDVIFPGDGGEGQRMTDFLKEAGY